jgi:hypothetical protein
VYTVPAWRDRRASGGDKAAGRGVTPQVFNYRH